MTPGQPVTVDAALAAVGQPSQVHTMAVHNDGHMIVGVMQRDVFACIIKMPTCKLSISDQPLIDLQYSLRVETTERVFHVYCTNPLASE